MANRWGKMETVTEFIFLGSKIMEDSHCNHEIKTVALWREVQDGRGIGHGDHFLPHKFIKGSF